MERIEEQHIVGGISEFCSKHAISRSGVLAITIQCNRSADFTSLIVNFDDSTILSNYPDPASLTKGLYKELKVEGFMVAYRDNLPILPIAIEEMPALSTLSIETPFCCDPSSLTPYLPRQLEMDHVFRAFLNGIGTDDISTSLKYKSRWTEVRC